MSYRSSASYRFGASKETGCGNVLLIIVNGLDTITVTQFGGSSIGRRDLVANNAAGVRLRMLSGEASFRFNCATAAKAFNTIAAEGARLAGEKSPLRRLIYSIFGDAGLRLAIEAMVSASSVVLQALSF